MYVQVDLNDRNEVLPIYPREVTYHENIRISAERIHSDASDPLAYSLAPQTVSNKIIRLLLSSITSFIFLSRASDCSIHTLRSLHPCKKSVLVVNPLVRRQPNWQTSVRIFFEFAEIKD